MFGAALMDIVALGRLVLMQAAVRAKHDEVIETDDSVRRMKRADNAGCCQSMMSYESWQEDSSRLFPTSRRSPRAHAPVLQES